MYILINTHIYEQHIYVTKRKVVNNIKHIYIYIYINLSGVNLDL